MGSEITTGEIVVSGLTKYYKEVKAVDGLSFTVKPGRVTGFLGPNGAGKTTTLRMLLNLVTPTAGTATIGGRRYADLTEPMASVGAILEASSAHRGRTGRNHLRVICAAAGLPASRADEVLQLVGLTPAATRKFKGYSLGMRQRLGIAGALLGDPPVLLFDEPVNGLDPEGIVWIRGLLRSLAAEGRAVLVSSHLMGELEGSADHLIVIGRGRLIADTTVRELLAAASADRVELRTSDRTAAMTVLANAGATVAATDHDRVTVTGVPPEQIVKLLNQHDLPFSEVAAHRASLEEAYMDLTRDAVEFAAHARPRAVS
jgi:ABC-2 type transport system ATP-binding protein